MRALDLALLGGRVRTLDPDRPSATAVGVAGGAIVAVGSDAEVRELADGSTEIVDLAGAAVTPGITDSHIHPFLGADGSRGADLLDAHTLEEVRAAMAEERARCAPGQWVLGWGLDYNVFGDEGISGSAIEDAVVNAFAARIEYALNTHVDHKTELQEALARSGRQVSYAVLSAEGPAHERRFTCAAVVGGVELGVGEGQSKKAAEQEAAREALAKLAAE